jgi:hypothetical protein
MLRPGPRQKWREGQQGSKFGRNFWPANKICRRPLRGALFRSLVALGFYDLNLLQTQCWLLLPQLAAFHGVGCLSVFSDNVGGGVLFLLSNC